MFSHHLRLLSFVPRWQIAPRFRTQTVAEHSYFVALYTMQLLQHKTNWREYMHVAAISHALQHDVAEARTGDMPGPVKRAVVDRDKLEAYETEALALMGVEELDIDEVAMAEIEALVKVADLIDEYFHVATEIAMGNSLIRPQLNVTRERFEAAVSIADLPYSVVQRVDEEVASLNAGVQLPKNSSATDPLTARAQETDEEQPF